MNERKSGVNEQKSGVKEQKSGVYQTGVLAEEAAKRGGVVLMVSSNYGTGCRRVT